MAQTIKLKRSSQPDASGVPTENQLELGEVAINTYHGKMYMKKSDGASPTPNEEIVEITPTGKADKAGDTFTGDVIIDDTNNLEVGYQHDNTGDRNIVNGYENTVTGSNANVSGQSNTVSGGFGSTTGYLNTVQNNADRNIVNGYANYAYGTDSIVSGSANTLGSTSNNCVIGGTQNLLIGSECFAFGRGCTVGHASRWFSASFGYQTFATGTASFSGGRSWYDSGTHYTKAEADACFAFGSATRVYDNAASSVALGTLTQCGESPRTNRPTASQSMAIGYKCKAYRDNSFAGGNESSSFGDTSFSFGNGSVASNGYSNIALGRGVTTPVYNGAAITGGAVSVGQWNEYDVNIEQHFSVGTGTAEGSRYTSMYVGPRSSADSGIVMPALKDSTHYDTDTLAGLAGVPIGGLYRYYSYVRIRMS